MRRLLIVFYVSASLCCAVLFHTCESVRARVRSIVKEITFIALLMFLKSSDIHFTSPSDSFSLTWHVRKKRNRSSRVS